jgi:hypothetical protein
MDLVDGHICTVEASEYCPDSTSKHSFYRYNQCYTNIAAEMSTDILFSLFGKVTPQTYTINAYNEEKGYSSTHSQRQLHGLGKASGNICAEACW